MALTKVIGDGVGVLTTADEGKLKIQTGTTSASYLSFADGDNNRGYVKYDHNNDSLELGVAGESHFNINNAHILTMDKQPAFQAIPASKQENMTVNGNTVIAFGTERFDQNGDFASNSFTAPVTGKYQLNLLFYFTAVDADATYVQIELRTSNKTYYGIFDPAAYDEDATFYGYTMAVLADMDANDTSSIVIIQGGGSAQMDVEVSSTFSGYLVC